jgi:hypothetical protein
VRTTPERSAGDKEGRLGTRSSPAVAASGRSAWARTDGNRAQRSSILAWQPLQFDRACSVVNVRPWGTTVPRTGQTTKHERATSRTPRHGTAAMGARHRARSSIERRSRRPLHAREASIGASWERSAMRLPFRAPMLGRGKGERGAHTPARPARVFLSRKTFEIGNESAKS